VIQSGSGISKEDIERMVNEAKTHEAEDQQRRAEIETRNQADSLVYNTEKLLTDNAEKVPEDLKTEVEAKIATLKAAIEANNVAEMQTAMTEVNDTMQRLGQAVYSQSGDTNAGDGMGGPEGPDGTDGDESGGGTVEGEFREV